MDEVDGTKFIGLIKVAKSTPRTKNRGQTDWTNYFGQKDKKSWDQKNRTKSPATFIAGEKSSIHIRHNEFQINSQREREELR